MITTGHKEHNQDRRQDGYSISQRPVQRDRAFARRRLQEKVPSRRHDGRQLSLDRVHVRPCVPRCSAGRVRGHDAPTRRTTSHRQVPRAHRPRIQVLREPRVPRRRVPGGRAARGRYGTYCGRSEPSNRQLHHLIDTGSDSGTLGIDATRGFNSCRN